MLENFFNNKLERIGKFLGYIVARPPLFLFVAWADRKVCESSQPHSKSEELSLEEGRSILAEALVAFA